MLSYLRGFISRFLSELRVLYALVFHRVEGDSHQARLISFYKAQAGDYDAFRKRLLHGREALVAELVERSPGGSGLALRLLLLLVRRGPFLEPRQEG